MVPEWVYLAVAGLLIGMMRAGFGGGIGVVAAPMLALTMPAKSTLGVVLPLTLAADLISVKYYWGHWVTPLVRALAPGCIAGIGVGWFLLDLIPEDVFRRLLGGTAIVFALIQPVRERLVALVKEPGHLAGATIGVATGVVSTLLHSGGVVLMLFLIPQGLTGRRFVGTAFLVGVIINIFKLIPYLNLGILSGTTLRTAYEMLPFLIIGALLGILLNHRLSVVWFNWVVLVLVLVVGLRLVMI